MQCEHYAPIAIGKKKVFVKKKKPSFAFGWGFLSGCQRKSHRIEYVKFLYREDFSDFVPIVPYIYYVKVLYIEDF
jgi:hypothetical protein